VFAFFSHAQAAFSFPIWQRLTYHPLCARSERGGEQDLIRKRRCRSDRSTTHFALEVICGSRTAWVERLGEIEYMQGIVQIGRA
jgi:hypothetical protein